MMIQLLLSVHFIHIKGFVHRDIKPENILINSYQYGLPKLMIGDFGLADRVPEDPNIKLYEYCGTPCYMAPEVLNRNGYREKADLFSLGSVFFNLLTNMSLFRGRDTDEQLAENKKCNL